jgi:PAS domain-containing protein
MAQITIKCYLNNEVRLLGSHKASITLKSLKKKLKKEYKRDLDIKYKDADGDLIAIRKPSHLRDAVRNILDEGGHALRLHLIDKPNTISLTESDILESLVSAAVVIDTAGKILLFNTSAEKLLGYDRKEVVGKNVKVLMPSSDAADHDKYLQNYLKTGKAKIIGTGRQVKTHPVIFSSLLLLKVSVRVSVFRFYEFHYPILFIYFKLSGTCLSC